MDRISIGAFKRGHIIIYRADISSDIIHSFAKSNDAFFEEPLLPKGNMFYDGERLFLHEWEKYKVQSTDNSFTPDDFIKIGEFGTDSYGTILFKNCAGHSQFRDIDIVVESSKISEEGMRHLTELVNSYIVNLSYDFNQATASQISRKRLARTDLDYHIFLLIHNAMRTDDHSVNIPTNWQLIMNNPCRDMAAVERYEQLSLVNDISDRSITDILSGSVELVECDNPNNKLANLLSRGGKRYIPKEIYVEETIDTFDNPENRFIKFFFLFCRNLLETFQQRFLAETNLFNRDIVQENESDINRLNTIINTSFLKNVGDIQSIPMYSTVLTRRDGYRQLFNLFLGLRTIPSIEEMSENLKELLENKALDVLYENYCYFTIADILASIYHERLDKKKFKVLKTSFSKTLEKKTNSNYFEFQGDDRLPRLRVHYNKNYTVESYSKPFDPDISIEILDEEGKISDIYVFDAKFKMSLVETGEETGEDRKSFKYDDISKMHTYRDAIKVAHGAFVLYPGTEEKIYYEDKKKNKDLMYGVGAFPLRPSNDTDIESIRQAVASILLSDAE